MIKLLKIGQKASQKEVFAWNILGSLASAAMSTLLLLSELVYWIAIMPMFLVLLMLLEIY